MIPLRAEEVEGVRLAAGDGARLIERVVVDSREVRAGDLFCALRGAHGDGHAYVQQAAERGAAAVLVEGGRAGGLGAVAVLEAPDVLAGLQGLARQVRRRARAKVVGIAGSAGKTTTKDVLRALCAPHAATVANHANHNNELGVPLTLLRLEPATEIAVCEMAMRAAGEIAELCAIAEPDAGLITNVGPEHLEFLGTVENVARTEAELLAALPPGGLAVVPHAERLLDPYRRDDVRTLTFGLDAAADVHPVAVAHAPDGVRLELDVVGERAELTSALRASHATLNVCAAVAVYAGLGLPVAGVGEGAAGIAVSPYRGEERPRLGGGLVINDAYNANPLSMQAALRSLVDRAEGARTVAVLGEMAELGPSAPRFHREVGRVARAAGVDVVVAVGDLARGYLEGAEGVEGHWFPRLEAAAEALPELVRDGDVVLVKASRSAGLERLDAVIA